MRDSCFTGAPPWESERGPVAWRPLPSPAPQTRPALARIGQWRDEELSWLMSPDKPSGSDTAEIARVVEREVKERKS
jgi:hypothetical protein